LHNYHIVGDNTYREVDGILRDVPTPRMAHVKPRNPLQKLAWLVCDDPRYAVVALQGGVGTGKTMIAILSSLQKLRDGVYRTLMYTRPPVPKQYEMGFLPGTEQEKLEPWMLAFYDQIELCAGKAEVERLIRTEQIQFISIDKVKGRTFRDSVLIVDEAQDTSEDTVELLIGRMGEGSKIILVGDQNQIDARGVTQDRNGLAHIRVIDDQPEVAIVTLSEPVRSRAAQLSLLLSMRRMEREERPRERLRLHRTVGN